MKPSHAETPRPPGRRTRRLALWGLLALLALAAGHTALWYVMAGQIEQGFAIWVAQRRAQGWRVEHAPPMRGGWPFSASSTIPGLRLEGASATVPGGVALASDRVVLRVVLPRIDRLRVEMPATQRLRIGGIDLPFAADRLEAVVMLAMDTPPSGAELRAERLRIGTPQGPVEIGALWLSTGSSTTATETESALDLRLSLEALDLPMPPALAGGAAAPALARFGKRIDSLALALQLSGPVPPGRAPASRAEAWREGGGTLEVAELALRWGPVGAQGSATIALDDELQPMGAGVLRIAGGAEALAALADAGVIGRRAAATARAMLPFLSRPTGAEGGSELDLALTLEDRTLTVARIPVLRMAPWVWPAP